MLLMIDSGWFLLTQLIVTGMCHQFRSKRLSQMVDKKVGVELDFF